MPDILPPHVDPRWADHRCPWREQAEAHGPTIERLASEIAAIQTAADAERAAAAAELSALRAAAEERINELEQQIAQLQRQVFGPKSEKMPPVAEELAKDDGRQEERRAAGQRKRRENEALKRGLLTERVNHRVPDEKRRCPKCGREDMRPLGGGNVTVEYDWIPGHFVRREHVQEVLTCRCGEHMATAP